MCFIVFHGLVTKSCLVACQAPLSMGFSRQRNRGGLLFPSPGDLPNSGIKPTSPAFYADSLLLRCQGSPLSSIIKSKKNITSFMCVLLLHYYMLSFILWHKSCGLRYDGNLVCCNTGSPFDDPSGVSMQFTMDHLWSVSHLFWSCCPYPT